MSEFVYIVFLKRPDNNQWLRQNIFFSRREAYSYVVRFPLQYCMGDEGDDWKIEKFSCWRITGDI